MRRDEIPARRAQRQVTCNFGPEPGWPFCQGWQLPCWTTRFPNNRWTLHHLSSVLHRHRHLHPALDIFERADGTTTWLSTQVGCRYVYPKPFNLEPPEIPADISQSIAAATSELWPSISNTLLIPWRGSACARSTQNTPTTRPAVAPQPKSSTTSTASAKDDAAHRAPRDPLTKAKTALPDFLRDPVSPRFLDRRLANASPTNIFSEISNMSPRSLTMANPLMRRSYAALTARPLTTLPGLRSMSTYQPSRMQQFTWIKTQQPSRNTQSRGFGTSGVSRDLLANREGAANRNPNSATAQSSFYQLLLKANMPAIVVERYQSGRSEMQSRGCQTC